MDAADRIAGVRRAHPSLFAQFREEALRFQEEKGVVVLKIANEDIIHKSDQGLVKTNLSSSLEVGKAFDFITQRARTLLPPKKRPIILVQEMIDNGLEFILGARTDPQFGKIVMFGLGGLLVELYKDVVFRVLPIDDTDAHQMIEELKGRKILDGFRNFPAIKILSIAVCWAAVSVFFPLYEVGYEFNGLVYIEFFQRVLILISITLRH